MKPTTKNNILDTNVIVRFLVGDNTAQQKQAITWFKQAEKGTREIVITPTVIAESCYVLESFYAFDREIIAEKMRIFLSQRWLHVSERSTLTGLWEWYLKNFHFVDSYLLCTAKLTNATILSFDKKVKKQ